MNMRPKPHAVRESGFSMIESLVYMALFVIVVGFATFTFYDCWDNTKAVRRNADDISRVLDMGERWRADVRGATGVAQLTIKNGAEQLRIPGLAGEVTYTFANSEIHRQTDSAAPDTLWLANVKSSHMQSTAPGPVAAWRWELELKSARKDPRLRPLFTFECAARTGAIP
jgi:Tfp pilus assembly protein FimT